MKDVPQESVSLPEDRVSPITEGKKQNEQTTMMTQDHTRMEFIGLEQFL